MGGGAGMLTRQGLRGSSEQRGPLALGREGRCALPRGKPVAESLRDSPAGLVSGEVSQSDPGYTDVSTLNCGGLPPTDWPPGSTS